MENEKTLAEQELEILHLMDCALNSRRRWAAIERLLGYLGAQLSKVQAARVAQQAEYVRNRPPIIGVAQAVRFLDRQLNLLALQAVINPWLWRVVSRDGEFEPLMDETALVEFARQERDIQVALGNWLQED